MIAEGVTDKVKDVAKQGAGILFFSCITWLSDFAGLYLSKLQVAILGNVPTLHGSAVGVLAGIITLFEAFVYDFGITNRLILPGVGLVAFSPFIISLFTLCIFLAITLVSPRGSYALPDYFIAFGVFLLEAMPVVCGFTFWGAFSVFIRRKAIRGLGSGITGSLPGSLGSKIGESLKKISGK